MGASVVNALSEWMEIDNCYEGKRYTMRFERGEIARPFACVGDTDRHGLFVRFKPDGEIFTDTTTFDTDTLLTRLREQAFLNAGIRIVLRDERVDLDAKKEDKVEDEDIRRLLGDYKYGSKKWNDRYKKEWKIEDQVLHAYQLTMPGMKKELENLSGKTFYAKVPEVFWKLIKETAWEHGTREALEVLH